MTKSALITSISFLLACALTFQPCQAAQGAGDNADLPLDSTFQVAPQAPETVQRPCSDSEKQAVKKVLSELFQAYKTKDLQQILNLLGDCFEASAVQYATDHPNDKDAKDNILYAYKAFHKDIFNHKDYQLDEFSPDYADYSVNEDGTVEVISPVPIISAKALSFEDDDGNSFLVRLRLGRFILKQQKGQWRIMEMDLF